MIKLIEALKKIEQCSDCGSYEATIIYMKSVASEALNNQQPSNEWVSFEHSFPEKDTALLICNHWEVISVDYHDSDFENRVENKLYKYWQPLPLPPTKK